MLQDKLKLSFFLSKLIIILMIITSASGFFFREIYQANATDKAGWYGNDLVTLFIALPLLIVGLFFSQRGLLRGQLIWLGMLHYVFYNYAFYLFGATINWFFGLYIVLFTLPMFTILFALTNLNIHEFVWHFHSTKPARWISGYMFFWAGLLGVAWTVQWVGFLRMSSLDVEQGNFIRTVGGIDLSLLASGLIVGAIWLWKQKIWGYVVATVLNVSGTIYTLVLTVGSFAQAKAGIEGATALIPLWVFLGSASFMVSIIMLRNLKSASDPLSNDARLT